MPRPSYPLSLAWLTPAVILSGATALVYEIVWTRRLALVLGSTTEAASATLSSFMLGLAIGAVLVGQRADVSRRPLRWYGILELGIGIYALAFDGILELVSGSMAGSPWLTSFFVLLVPAALMGGTLPVLARAGSHTTERGTLALGSLYGWNTLGAVLGAIFTTLFLLETLGLSGATMVAAFVNLALGVTFWVLGTMAGDREMFASEEERAPQGWTGDADFAVLAGFFLAGFAGLALEIAWVRLLVYFLEGFTIAFGLMLAAYLLGLGAGALGGTYLALQATNPRRLLARIFLVEAVLAVGTYLFAGPLGSGLEEMRRGYVAADGMDFTYGMGLFLTACAVVLPATFCAGMLLPAVARIALSDREAIGRQSGALYAASTVGAVIAPPAAAFWLIPTYGVGTSIVLLGGLVLAAGTWIAFTKGLREFVFAGAATLLFVVVVIAGGFGEPPIEKSHVFGDPEKHPRRLLAFETGVMAGVGVVEEMRDGARRLYLDDFSAAETGSHYSYMRMLGHLPVLLHPAPKRTLVIAFGTGTTAGAVAAHPEVEEVVCVEIEPAVYDVAPYFEARNRGVLDSPKAERVVADGREYVRRDVEPFDVVTLEPLMPYSPAAVYLYTKEFYEAARARMARGGILCQWIPPQGVSAADLKRLVQSVQAAFAHTSLWYFEHAVLVVGTESAPKVDPIRLLQRLAVPEVRDDLIAARVADPAHLLGAHVCSGDALKRALGDAEPMVDDRTYLEFRPVPRRFGKRSQGYHAENLAFLAEHHMTEVPWLDGMEGVDTALASTGAALRTLAVEMERRVEGGKVVPASALQGALDADPRSLFVQSIHDRRLYGELVANARYGEAARLRLAPDRSVAYLALAEEARQEDDAEQRTSYLILAVRENHLLEPELLDELAQTLEGPAARFCRNRARFQRGEAMEEGPEEVPAIALRSITEALRNGDEELAREILDDAEKAGLLEQTDREAWNWYQDVPADDRREAVLLMHRIGSRHAWRAALKLFGKGRNEDLRAIAPIFCPRYPQDKMWERLCRHVAPDVRAAAADAARGTGTRAHLPVLFELCSDREEDVRLSAWLSMREILGEKAADGTGYDPTNPSPEALATLEKLISE